MSYDSIRPSSPPRSDWPVPAAASSFAGLIEGLDQQDQKRRGDQFERLCFWLLHNDPVYRDQLRRVWYWRDWPDAWSGRDAGIDLVAEQADGGLWAIQAKAYDPRYQIKKSDVDSFLSESSRPGFVYRLLIATTDHLGATAGRTVDQQERPVGLLLRSQLEATKLDWPRSLEALRPARPQPRKPFPHQGAAIEDAVRGLRAAARGQVIMAAGTGKTLVGLWITETLGADRTLVLVPSISLLAQTLKVWKANANGPFPFLAICSDRTVAGEDEVVAHTSELGLPVTTDPGRIADFLAGDGRRVVFCTYQSSREIAAACRLCPTPFDLVIADEAHRTAGRVTSEFSTVLHTDQINARRRLFMTATPRFFTDRLRQEAADAEFEVASMDDHARYGEVLHRLTFGEAISRELLSDYQVVVIAVDDETYRSWAQRGEFVTTDGQNVTDARSLAAQIGLVKAMRNYDLRRVISFHARVSSARRFSADLPDVIAWMPPGERPPGVLWTEHVSGRMSSGDRERRLRQFGELPNGERGLLSNARCLTEGVDVPTIDGVIFVDPRRSLIDIIQAVGRAIRKAPDKKQGTIVIPVFVEHGADPEAVLERSEFERVWTVLRALRAHDEQLAEQLDELQRNRGRLRRHEHRPDKIKLDLPSTVDDRFARAFDARLVDQTTTAWEFWYGLAQGFAQREGHAAIEMQHVEDGHRLGLWVGTQRTKARKGTLDPDRRRRLEEIPGWIWDHRDTEWEQGFVRLRRFVAREGHAHVPQAHREDGHRLGLWVMVNRRTYREGRLAADRIKRLEAVPGWSWKGAIEEGWQLGYQGLQAYAQREGHARVPKAHVEDGFALGQWALHQRSAARRGVLTDERRALLEAVADWTWDPLETNARRGLQLLAQYAQREGHARVPQKHQEDGFPLGEWATGRRRAHKTGQLPGDQKRKLEQMPGWEWAPGPGRKTADRTWEQAVAILKRYVKRTGDARVPQRHVEAGFSLGRWVSQQRRAYTRDQLSEDRIARLEAVVGWSWDVLASDWEQGFEQLKHYHQRHGTALVAARFTTDDGYPLGQWVSVQRKAYQDGQLDHERQRRLNSLGDWAWDLRDQTWTNGLVKLQKFAGREGHARVPQHHREDDFLLGTWLSNRRADRAQLTAERQATLESIPGWTWNTNDAKWDANYDVLQAYTQREGHSNVSSTHRENEINLGSWVSIQRGAHRKGTLSQDRQDRLEALTSWEWNPAPGRRREQI